MNTDAPSMTVPVKSKADREMTTELAYLLSDIRFQQLTNSISWLIDNQPPRYSNGLQEALESVTRAQQIVGRLMSGADDWTGTLSG